MNKKTVLHILNTGEYSGAENVAITIIKNYPNYLQGIYMSRNGSISEILANEKICYYGVDKLSKIYFKGAKYTLQSVIMRIG